MNKVDISVGQKDNEENPEAYPNLTAGFNMVCGKNAPIFLVEAMPCFNAQETSGISQS